MLERLHQSGSSFQVREFFLFCIRQHKDIRSAANDLSVPLRCAVVRACINLHCVLTCCPELNISCWVAGNGSQWPRMALPLLESSPTFKRSILQCAAALQPLGIDLMAEFKAEQGWQAPKLAMVGLVAVQIGLVDLLREEHGITPAGMLGHSAGVSFSC